MKTKFYIKDFPDVPCGEGLLRLEQLGYDTCGELDLLEIVDKIEDAQDAFWVDWLFYRCLGLEEHHHWFESDYKYQLSWVGGEIPVKEHRNNYKEFINNYQEGKYEVD